MFYEGPTLHRTYLFPCHRWLSAESDDNKTDRMLQADPTVPYLLTIRTLDEAQAGTDAASEFCVLCVCVCVCV